MFKGLSLDYRALDLILFSAEPDKKAENIVLQSDLIVIIIIIINQFFSAMYLSDSHRRFT